MAVQSIDVLLVGGGIMSATLGVLLKLLDSNIKIVLVEQLDEVAQESSSGWNNAGTGHAAYCELNYTPETSTGNIDVTKALSINGDFEVSLQLWSYLIEQGYLPKSDVFIRQTPHYSLVWGEDNVDFLKRRFEALSAHSMFEDMEFSDQFDTIKNWIPLCMEGRDASMAVAATRVNYGTDVDFGALTHALMDWLRQQPNVEIRTLTKVTALSQNADQSWNVDIEKLSELGTSTKLLSNFVFLGAGGAALPLLQSSGVSAASGYGGFPVSGQWLVCRKPDVVNLHHAKVYGKAALGAPPMSVPHLDTRVINGEKALLFGPFAGFTTKFLKQGSAFDLIKSIRLNNIIPMIQVGLRHHDLTRYLISEVMQSHEDRMASLRAFFPEASSDDWQLEVAGQRVQVIKKDAEKGGVLEFGTELVVSDDCTLSALLGASPGASVSVSAMLNVLERCFTKQMSTQDWQDKLKQMIPSFGQDLTVDSELLSQIRSRTLSVLQLNEKE